MTPVRVVPIVAILVLGGAAAAVGQATPPSDQASRAVMRSDLRNLVTSQESFFADQLRYSRSLDSLSFRVSPGTSINIEEANGTGWRATARRAGVYGKCTIFVGSARRPGSNEVEGQPLCDVADTDFQAGNPQDALLGMGPALNNMMGSMYSAMYEQLFAVMSRPETADRMATFAKNYFDALIQRGFTRAEALQLVAAASLPSAR